MLILIVRRFHRALTTLVTDSQFSALGVTLISVLARVAKIIGLPSPRFKDLGMKVGMETLVSPGAQETGEETGNILPRGNGGDLGKVLRRRIDSVALRGADILKGENPSKHSVAADAANKRDIGVVRGNEQVTIVIDKGLQQEKGRTKSQAIPKKTHKKGNAIDDLFGDL